MNSDRGRILVAGANGHLGRRLLARLPEARALVRSQRAVDAIRADGLECEVVATDYTDSEALAKAAEGCTHLVHLVGILKEAPGTSYQIAHELTSARFLAAARDAGLQRIVYLSILGANPESENACLVSKGRAEEILLAGAVPALVIRLPMVLGRGDYASAALRNKARAKLLLLVRGGATLEQPIDANDVLDAIQAGLAAPDLREVALDLGGPESLSHRELVLRAAALYENHPRIFSMPYGVARSAVKLMGRLSKNPPVTLPMLEVLEHDDSVDAAAAAARLGIELTPLDETLRRCVGPASQDGEEPA